jgi:DNA-nicking Smr family endonuclease
VTRRRDSERKLGADERRLWARVVSTVTPRPGTINDPDLARLVNIESAPADAQRPALHSHPARSAPPAADSSRLARARHSASRNPPDTPPHDRSSERRVRRGRVDVDATLDLHGMTADRAVRSLQRCLERQARDGARCVLVITGKGGVAQDGGYAGILHRSFAFWLERDDIRPLLSGYAPAHTRHGGAGAWYVFLKPVDRPGAPFR